MAATMDRQMIRLNSMKGAKKLARRYKGLIGKRNNTRQMIAGTKGAVLLSVFNERLNPVMGGNENEFNPELAKRALRSFEMFERLLDNMPKLLNDYVEVFEKVSAMKRNAYYENILPMLDKTLDIVESWNTSGYPKEALERIETKLAVLERSVSSCISMIDFFNKQHIYEKNGGIPKMHPPRERLIEVYLNRVLIAMGNYHEADFADFTADSFGQIDLRMRMELESIENVKERTEYANEVVGLNMEIAKLLGNEETELEYIVETVRYYGLGTLIAGIEEYKK